MLFYLYGSLFFNPMNDKIYDYVNGVSDVRQNKVKSSKHAFSNNLAFLSVLFWLTVK
jgi:hypothetical protein